MIVVFFCKSINSINFSISDFFHFIFCVDKKKVHFEKYKFLDQIVNEKQNFDQKKNYINNYEEGYQFNIINHFSKLKKEHDICINTDECISIDEDIYIDKDINTDEENLVEIDKKGNIENASIEKGNNRTINKNISYESINFDEDKNFIDANNNLKIDEMNNINNYSKISQDIIIENSCVNEQVNKDTDEDDENKKIINFVEINEQNYKEIINFCLNYLNKEKIIKNIIKNELNSVLFLKFSYNIKVLSLYEKSKYIYSYLNNLKKCNIFIFIKILVKLLLKNKRKQRNYIIYHFFVILHILYYLKKNLCIRRKDENKIEEEHIDFFFIKDEKMNGEFSGNNSNENDSKINYLNECTYNLDETVTNKISILKSLVLLLFIKLMNMFLPSINKIYFNNIKEYLYIDKYNDDIKLKCDINDFILLILNFINRTYTKGYEFIYMSLLFLMEYCIELLCDNNDIKPINVSNILIINKAERIINEYKKDYVFLEETNNVIKFITKEYYDKIKKALSAIYLKILRNCDNSILIACKIIIGNRLNLEDEMDLLKTIKSDFLFFFTFNNSILKSNKQTILLQNNFKKIGKEKNDFFQTKIYTFIKILLIIITYNINSFKDSEYYQTIKQIISDNQWFCIFNGHYINEADEINFLCKKKNKDNDTLSDSSSTELNESLKFYSLNTTKNISETYKKDKISDEENSKNFNKEKFREQFKMLDLESSNEIKNSNEVINSSKKGDNIYTGKNIVEKYERLYYENENENNENNENNNNEMKDIKIEDNNDGLNSNLFKSNEENCYINEALSEKQSNGIKENIELNKEEDEFFKFNITKSKDDILNEYGKGFSSYYLNKLNNNEKCEKYFNEIYKKSKMINLMEYCKHILRYWKIEMEIDKKNEGIEILIFFANYFNFFQNFIKYKIILKLYMNNNLNEADEILGNKGIWSWYRNDMKIKSNIETYLSKNIYFNNFFINQGDDKFLKNLSKIYYKNNFRKDHFYLKNYLNNKCNKLFLRSIYGQYYSFNKYIKKCNEENITDYNLNSNRKEEKDSFNSMNNISKEQKVNEQNNDYNEFPLFFLSFLELYKNTVDVYDFYYQSVLYKLMNNHELNTNKTELLYEDLKKYFQNKLNYDLYVMLFFYQYFSFQSIYYSNTSTNYLKNSEQKLIIYIWIKYTQSLLKKYRSASNLHNTFH